MGLSGDFCWHSHRSFHFHAAYFHVRGRQGQAAQRHAEALVALTSEHGFAQRLAHGMILRGAALAVQGQGAERIVQMRQGLAAKRATGAMLGEVVESWLAGRGAQARGAGRRGAPRGSRGAGYRGRNREP